MIAIDESYSGQEFLQRLWQL